MWRALLALRVVWANVSTGNKAQTEQLGRNLKDILDSDYMKSAYRECLKITGLKPGHPELHGESPPGNSQQAANPQTQGEGDSGYGDEADPKDNQGGGNSGYGSKGPKDNEEKPRACKAFKEQYENLESYLSIFTTESLPNMPTPQFKYGETNRALNSIIKSVEIILDGKKIPEELEDLLMPTLTLSRDLAVGIA